jgi:hypothetical protein
MKHYMAFYFSYTTETGSPRVDRYETHFGTYGLEVPFSISRSGDGLPKKKFIVTIDTFEEYNESR